MKMMHPEQKMRTKRLRKSGLVLKIKTMLSTLPIVVKLVSKTVLSMFPKHVTKSIENV